MFDFRLMRSFLRVPMKFGARLGALLRFYLLEPLRRVCINTAAPSSSRDASTVCKRTRSFFATIAAAASE